MERKTLQLFFAWFAMMSLAILVVIMSPVAKAAVNDSVKFDPATIARVTSQTLLEAYPSVAVDSNNISHVVSIYQYTSGQYQLMYTNNASGSFAAPVVIDTLATIADDSRPVIVFANGALHLTYTINEKQVIYRQGTLSGVWGPAVTVVAAGANKVYNGGLAVEPGGTVDLVYIDNQCGQYNVYLKQYTGGVMGAALPAMNECVGKNRARVVYAGGRVHVVFRRDLDIYYTSFAAGGWSTAVNISNSPATQSYNPDIATNGSAIFISWGENQNNHDVLLRYSPDSGQSWSGEMSVSGSAPVFADMATLTWVPAVNRGYIVWSDASNGVGGKNDIYFHEFEATPASFTNPVKVSCIDADSNWPVIAAGPGKAEIVWQDRSVGNQLYLFHLAGQVGNGQVTISCGAAAPVSTPVPAIPPGATVTPFPTTPLATPTKGPTPTLSFPTLGAPIDTTAPRPTDVSYVSDPKPVQYDASTPWILFILVGGIVLVFGHGIFF